MVNREAVEQVAKDLEGGELLTYAHIGSIFGDEFYFMLIESFMDAQDAARAIQGAIARLGATSKVPKVIVED